MKKIAVIGGGIIGLSAAYYLRKADFDVTVFDQADMTDGCSYGNAGMVVPSHLVPLAAPGMIHQGIRWMFNAESPFYIRPRFDRDLIRWGYHFYKSATHENVLRGATALKELSLLSQATYEVLSKELPDGFGYQRRGLLMMYQTRQVEEEEKATAEIANRLGIEAEVLSEAAVQKLEPEVEVKVRGAVYFPGDSHLTPRSFMEAMKLQLLSDGVQFKANEGVKEFVKEGGIIKKLVTTQQEYSFDEYVLAAGSWSEEIARSLDLSLPLQPGKGYSMMTQTGHRLRIPAILMEARVAVTPMDGGIRFGGTMEMSGMDHTINMSRVKGIVDAVPKYYPGIHLTLPAREAVWHGLRPCSPDGLPYIGRPARLRNLIVATGHAMMGVSLAPGTGELVAEIATGVSSSLPLSPFRPDRF